MTCHFEIKSQTKFYKDIKENARKMTKKSTLQSRSSPIEAANSL
jgi:hypothetical protein